ncbi:MAG: P22 coat protein - protein 5 domain protein [Armatimonadota bacterium]
MALTNFIPEVWSARLLANLHKNLVYGQEGVINRDYEGEIVEAGDTVRINAVGPVTVSDYTRNSDHDTPETLSDAETILQITQAKMFNFQIDDVDRAQQKPSVMDGAMREAGYALADTADQFIAGKYLEAAAANLIGSTAAPKTDLGTGGRAYEYLVDLKVKLDEANVPRWGRWCVVPPWYEGLLLKDDRFVSYGTAENRENLANGEVGRAAGFRLLVSNNVPNTTGAKFRIVAGHPLAWSFAEQIRKVEAFRPERRFADAVKGLHLYGVKVVRPVGLAVLTADQPA